MGAPVVVWVKLDDKFHGHRKTLALFDGPCAADAIALWTLANSWCGDQLTDGVVPLSFVRRSGLDKRAPDELLRVGLWHRHEQGFEFHEWLKRNKSREQVEKERAAALERKLNGKKSVGGNNGVGRKKFARTSEEPPPEFEQSSSLPDPDPIEDACASSSERASDVREKSEEQQLGESVRAQLLRLDTVTPEDVQREWKAAAPMGSMHGLSHWMSDWAAIAETINSHPRIRPDNRAYMLRKLMVWFHKDPSGPVGDKRVPKGVTPDRLAKRCASDLEQADKSEWEGMTDVAS